MDIIPHDNYRPLNILQLLHLISHLELLCDNRTLHRNLLRNCVTQLVDVLERTQTTDHENFIRTHA